MTNTILKQRIQRRCCGVCGKHGHNKSTCPQFLASIITAPKPLRATSSAVSAPQAVPRGINFFIHHVSHSSEQSPHVVNLKNTRADLWENVKSVAPQNNQKLYHYYHETLTTPAPAPQITPVIINDEFDLPVLNTSLTPAVPTKSRPIEFTPAKPQRLRAATNAVSQYTSNLKNVLNEKLNRAAVTVEKALTNQLLWRRAAVTAAVVLIFGVAPMPAKQYLGALKSSVGIIAQSSLAGFSSLEKSVSSLLTADTAQAQTDLNSALNSFDAAVTEMQTKHRFLQTVARALPIISTEFESRQNIILAGPSIALGNSYLLSGYADSQNTSTTLTDRLNIISKQLKSALPHYQNALARLEPTEATVLPEQYRDEFKNFKVVFAALVNDLTNLSQLSDQLPEIFGGQGLRRYLLVFQNEHEIRPTGGFMGSFALLEIKDGKIINIDVPPNGSYDLRRDSDVYLEPPAPLLLISKRFEFQDSNWYPDFPASAEKILWFYRHSRGITADGVIAINSGVFENLLKIIGPIQDENRQLTLAHDNALGSLQKIVEEGPEKKVGRPKQIITDLTPKIIEAALNPKPEQLLPLLSGLENALQEKQIQAYFTDASAQATVKKFGWSGDILTTAPDQDYLFVVNTNIHGEKSDARVKQTISHEAKIAQDGTVTDTVLITREHTGNPTEKFYGAPNIDYVRVYVPVDSELISAQGFTWPSEERFFAPIPGATRDEDLTKRETQIQLDHGSGTRGTREFGKTAFANWIITEPGQTSQAAFTYRLPFKVSIGKKESIGHYQMVVQKQSGINSVFDSQIITPDNAAPIWSEGEGATTAANGLQIGPIILSQDKIWSMVIKEK